MRAAPWPWGSARQGVGATPSTMGQCGVCEVEGARLPVTASCCSAQVPGVTLVL